MGLELSLIDESGARARAMANIRSATGAADVSESEQIRRGLLRLAAGRLCPCGRSALIEATQTALVGLIPPDEMSRDMLAEDVEALLGAGDLLSGRDESGRAQLFVAPPMYVRQQRGRVYVLGGYSESAWPLPSLVRERGVYRELEEPLPDLDLTAHGFNELPLGAWLIAPEPRSATALLAELDRALDNAPPSGEVPGLSVVDPSTPNGYYRGRWRESGRLSGRFVARRVRRWGGTGWGYVELVNGVPARYLSLPAIDTRFRGCDEAWWAIFAGDAARGMPQDVEVMRAADHVRVSTRTPIPAWAERRLALTGLEAPPPSGYLRSFVFRGGLDDADFEVLFVDLWATVRDKVMP